MMDTFPYPIHLGKGLLAKIGNLIPDNLRDHQFVIITDDQVNKLYGSQLSDSLQDQGIPTHLITFPTGEEHKTRETKAMIESQLLSHNYSRDTCLLALGGGVVGDLAGFTAATYMRGVPYIQIPTTLLAIIDSSIGGKTAVNTPEGKNLIGAFHQPSAVIADLNCLNTLPKPHLTNGWIEAIKIFLAMDAQAFHQVAQQSQPTQALIERAIDLKTKVVLQDPFESGLRTILNVGHTMGHAIEALSNYQILHGIAVGYGILIEAHIAHHLEMLDLENLELIKTVFNQYQINLEDLAYYDPDQLIAQTHRDKKVRQQQIQYSLITGLGEYKRVAVTDQDVKCALEEIHHVGK